MVDSNHGTLIHERLWDIRLRWREWLTELISINYVLEREKEDD